jgi:hypothetical protein
MANYYFAKPHGMQHCYIPFLYVIDFKGALNFGEAQIRDLSSAHLARNTFQCPWESQETRQHEEPEALRR